MKCFAIVLRILCQCIDQTFTPTALRSSYGIMSSRGVHVSIWIVSFCVLCVFVKCIHLCVPVCLYGCERWLQVHFKFCPWHFTLYVAGIILLFSFPSLSLHSEVLLKEQPISPRFVAMLQKGV